MAQRETANAYHFPLEAVSRPGEAGDDAGSKSPSAADTSQTTDQQQLDTVAAIDEGDHVADAAPSATDGGRSEGGAKTVSDETATMQAQLMTAIEALQVAKKPISAD